MDWWIGIVTKGCFFEDLFHQFVVAFIARECQRPRRYHLEFVYDIKTLYEIPNTRNNILSHRQSHHRPNEVGHAVAAKRPGAQFDKHGQMYLKHGT